MTTAGALARTVLRAPARPAAWAELAYTLVSVPLAALGTGYVLACFLLSGALAVTALGVPLLALGVPATRLLGRIRRGLAATLLAEHVPAPAAFRPGDGLFGRLRAGLRDRVGWRCMGYQMVSLPLSVTALAVAAVTWGWGLVALTYPIQHALRVNQMSAPGPGGTVRHGLVLGGTVLDSGPELLAVSAGGLLLLLLAPWPLRSVLLLDRLLLRALLGPDARAARIDALRRTRARAVEDAAATLRRIERDLHDGVQARLVALAVSLTAIAETLDRDPATARTLLAAARENARDAVGELRTVVRGIHPPVLDAGLDAAVATLAARSPVPVEAVVDLPRRPSAAIESIAYFCVAELLANVARHSGAAHARVAVSGHGPRLSVVVSDDGRGGARPDAPAGTGLRGLADRVATVDGTLAVSSPPGGPTTVTAEMPLYP